MKKPARLSTTNQPIREESRRTQGAGRGAGDSVRAGKHGLPLCLGWGGRLLLELDPENVRVLQLHVSRYAPNRPVPDGLSCPDLIHAEKPRKSSGAAVVFDEFLVCHASIKHHVYRFVNGALQTICLDS